MLEQLCISKGILRLLTYYLLSFKVILCCQHKWYKKVKCKYKSEQIYYFEVVQIMFVISYFNVDLPFGKSILENIFISSLMPLLLLLASCWRSYKNMSKSVGHKRLMDSQETHSTRFSNYFLVHVH